MGVMTEFKVCLTEEIDRREWSRNEQTRRANMPQAAASDILSSTRNAGYHFRVRIAGDLGLSPILVMTKPGMVSPQDADINIPIQKLFYVAKQLSEYQQEESPSGLLRFQ